MEIAASHYLSRTHTAPTVVHARLNKYAPPPPPLMQNNQRHTGSHSSAHYSSNSYISSRSSSSTQATSVSTLTGPTPPYPTSTPANGAPIEASNNVLNRRGDKETSLFQICLNLRLRLRKVPEFEQFLLEEEREADEDTDPVTLLWRTFRRGYPLLSLYNALSPERRIEIDNSRVNEKKRGQAATFKFLQACLSELRFPVEECFIITDLYNDDTTGFVKVNKRFHSLVMDGSNADTDIGDESR